MSYKETLNLPRTDFPIRGNAKENDPLVLKRWQEDDIYIKTFTHNAGKEKYILHDGPPYANGRIHLGHAYNKILKDVVGKSRRMSGMHVPITPGWDCHGLPIELKVTQEFPDLPAEALKKQCRLYAQKWVEVQKEQFKELGILNDWERPYLTMNFGYESRTLRAFGGLVEKGYIEKKLKTVAWCPSDQTVLASAEIEYKERKDPSIYVRFPLPEATKKAVFADFADKEIGVAVWTTTPWTLPLNRAVLLKPATEYQLLEVDGSYLIVASALSDKLLGLMEKDKKVAATFMAEELAGQKAAHPFIEGLEVPFLLDHMVSTQDGTAAVHCAPGCGPTDYELGVKEGLEIFSPISTDGKYTEGIAPKELEGMPVADGQIWVIKKLAGNGNMLYKTSLRHSYPHCWRCRNGLIFRATSQWFCNLSHNDLRARALKAIDTIQFLPERSVNFLKATLEGRLEWCLSRQRMWGVPIPAILCDNCSHVFTDVELIEKVARGVEKEGVEYWDTVSLADLDIAACQKCSSTNIKKEKDILDVWFDSGVSHYAVLYKNRELNYPANLYFEGVDQHRGWFQSSLLTSMILEETPCTKAILTHGFVVDKNGHKMSKSLGNVIGPDELIDQLGTDGLRLWATSIDYANDAIVSPELIKNVGHVYRKIRNTCRFLLSNLHDFDMEKDGVSTTELMMVDKYALVQLLALNESIQKAYDELDFTAVFHELNDYCTVTLSQVYMDITKDRLYTEKADGHKRRSAQTTMWIILDTLTKLMAPVLSFTAELVSDHYQANKKESIHLQDFNDLSEVQSMIAAMNGAAEFVIDEWKLVLEMRDALLKAIEVERQKGAIKHPLEAQLFVHVDMHGTKADLFKLLHEKIKQSGQSLEAFLKELLVVSSVVVESSPADLPEVGSGIFAQARVAPGVKCPRCWHWTDSQHTEGLCARCSEIIA